MKAILKSFRVKNFRSVQDSGWIDIDNCTCLVGTNESGKTNVINALWKLNPASDEKIIPLDDYPRKSFIDYEATGGKEVFIESLFDLSDEITHQLAAKGDHYFQLYKSICVRRSYNGDYSFLVESPSIESVARVDIQTLLLSSINQLNADKETDGVDNSTLVELLKENIENLPETAKLGKECLTELIEKLSVGYNDDLGADPEDENVFLPFDRLLAELTKIKKAFESNSIKLNEAQQSVLLDSIPKFVYYSDYGNLDSEIYLPHVIENFKRNDLSATARAKVRSLKVLFEYVDLSPQEILDLGQESWPITVVKVNNHDREISRQTEEPKDVDIEKESKQKKKREILLQSASVKLTLAFKKWWGQGDYKFRFQADGNHFRIWVSDDKRPEEIELEGRSRGLQWFFSFFLVFLVESKDSHSNCILLLDEPGLSLHPISQMDLIQFFNALAGENQLIYTTHSPFLVDQRNIGSIKALYVGREGYSEISADLRSNKSVAEQSIYPVHAAIGLSVSDTLLLGCQPILVEGVSDQIYFELIRKYILSKGSYKNDREIVFIATGGVKGMSPVIKILQGRDKELPFVILDSDKQGKNKAKQLKKGLYKDDKEKVIQIDQFLGEGAYEIEDLMPKNRVARAFARLYRRNISDDDFDYIYEESKPLVNQMEEYARTNEHELILGWKVDVAKEFRRNFSRIQKSIPEQVGKMWEELFKIITG